MAISAIDPKFADVVFMAKWHRLLRGDIDLLPGGALPIPIRNDQGHDEKECCDSQDGAQDVVMVGRENESSARFMSLRFHRQLGLARKKSTGVLNTYFSQMFN